MKTCIVTVLTPKKVPQKSQFPYHEKRKRKNKNAKEETCPQKVGKTETEKSENGAGGKGLQEQGQGGKALNQLTKKKLTGNLDGNVKDLRRTALRHQKGKRENEQRSECV